MILSTLAKHIYYLNLKWLPKKDWHKLIHQHKTIFIKRTKLVLFFLQCYWLKEYKKILFEDKMILQNGELIIEGLPSHFEYQELKNNFDLNLIEVLFLSVSTLKMEKEENWLLNKHNIEIKEHILLAHLKQMVPEILFLEKVKTNLQRYK